MSTATTVKSLFFIALGGLLLCQTAAASLGLGEARVQSFLGQPLDVRIALVQSGDSDLDSLEVSVASVEDHARLGVPSEALALGLSVTVDPSANPPVIQLRSTRAVADPFVQVLIDARWASGRMLREYTLFLDPPAVPVAPPIRRSEDRLSTPAEPARAPEQTMPSAIADQPEPAPESQPAARQQTELSSPPEAQVEDEPAAQAIVVEGGQTLWSIAAEWRPDDSLTMNQAMLAIFDRNPNAFMGNNVNRLRRGARLVLPQAAAARAIPPAEAARRFRDQIQAWEAGRSVPVAEPTQAAEPLEEIEAGQLEEQPAVPAADSDSMAPEAVDEQSAELDPLEDDTSDAMAPTPRLELTAPEEDLVAETAAIDAERQRLTDRLTELESEMALDGLQSPDADVLVDQIRQAIDSADVGGLMVASEELATLEEQLREAREAREAERQAAQEAAATPVEPPAAIAPGPLATAPASVLDRWQWPLLGGAVVFMLILLVLLLRRRAARQPEEDSISELQAGSESAGPGSSVAATAKASSDPETQVDESDRAENGQSAQAAALMGILSREEEEEASPSPGAATPVAEESRDIGNDEDGPDLARLSDRLDPDERDKLSPAASRDDSAVLDDEDLETLFATDETTEDRTDTPEEVDSGPLTLDFDLPEDDEIDAIEEVSEAGGPDSSGNQPAAEEPAEPRDELHEADQTTLDPADFEAEIFGNDEDLESVPDALGPGEAGEEADEDVGSAPAEEQTEDYSPEESSGAFELEEPEPIRTGDGGESSTSEAVPAEESAEEPVLSDEDAEVKLDLARAYVSMEDPESARTLLDEIISDGSFSHREQAQKLLDSLK